MPAGQVEPPLLVGMSEIVNQFQLVPECSSQLHAVLETFSRLACHYDLSPDCQCRLLELIRPDHEDPVPSPQRSVLADLVHSLQLKPIALESPEAPESHGRLEAPLSADSPATLAHAGILEPQDGFGPGAKRKHLDSPESIGPLEPLEAPAWAGSPGDPGFSRQATSVFPTSRVMDPRLEPEGRFRYVDLGFIGTGGMGEVRRVLDRDLNRVMAMKVIRADLLRQPAALARFLEEAQTTAQLEHPGIVPVHELGQLPDGRYYFTMKEVRGRTLKAVIQEVHSASPGTRWEPASSGWTFRRLIDAYFKVCEAVAYAHSRGVVHRDLKPSNVMVGGYGEVMVVDWGLAKLQCVPDRAAAIGALEPVVTRNREDSHLATHEGSVSGTPAYMPPEQARGEVERLGPASDVYALGAILYEILSGRPPYEGPDGLAVLGQVLSGPPVPPGRRSSAATEGATLSSSWSIDGQLDLDTELPPPLEGPPVPEELQAICLKAMARAMTERYPNAGALAAELDAWLEDARRRERAVKLVEEAAVIQPEVERLRTQAARLRTEAERLLEDVRPYEPITRKKPGWVLEDDARRLVREADLKEIEYLQVLRGSLTHVPDLPEAHQRLADYYREQHAAAEAVRDGRAVAQYEILLRAHDRDQYSAYLKGDGALTLITDPPGAEVLLYRYVEQDRRLVPELVRSLGRAPLRTITLPMGSYLLKLKARGRAEVHYPVSIGRLEHWDGVPPGESEPFPVYLPRPAELGANNMYVPAGWFWSGGDPEAYFGLPRQRLWVDGFVMRRFPVTNREYFAFLNDLVTRGSEEEALWWAPRQRSGEEEESSALIYSRNSRGRFVLPRDNSGEAWLSDYPAMLLDWHCAVAFASWEARHSGLPWRLPAELEWEKAARGVDARFYPWGDFVDPTWACALESHAEQPRPMAVDSYPVDESPYGVRGMGGNVRDWCLDKYRHDGPLLNDSRVVIPDDDREDTGALRVIRGGAWANSLRSVRVAFRSGGPSTDRFALLGFRLARSLPS